MSYKLKAGNSKIITRVEKKEEVIKGGLILIEGSSGNIVEGVVVATPSECNINISDKVIFDKSRSTEIKVDDIIYNVIDEKEILAILQAV